MRGGRGGGGIAIAPRSAQSRRILQLKFSPGPLEDPLQADSPADLVSKFSQADGKRPLFLFLTSREPKAAKTTALIEKTVFKDERVCLGAKFFRLCQIEAEKISRSHPLFKLIGGKKLPRIVLISMDGKTHKKMEGRVSAGRLFAAMKSIVRKDFKRNLGAFATKMRKILNEIDKLEGEKRRLENQQALAAKKGSKNAKAKLLEKKKALLESKAKALTERMKDLLAWTVPPEEKTAKND